MKVKRDDMRLFSQSLIVKTIGLVILTMTSNTVLAKPPIKEKYEISCGKIAEIVRSYSEKKCNEAIKENEMYFWKMIDRYNKKSSCKFPTAVL